MLSNYNKYYVRGQTPLLVARLVTEDDSLWITKWRNQKTAREAFFPTKGYARQLVVTPDTHRTFLRHKRLHDLIFIAEYKDWPIGMFALDVNVSEYTAEAGRFYIDEDERGKGFGKALDYLQLHLAFEFLGLEQVTGEIYSKNEARRHVAEDSGWEEVETVGDTLKVVYRREVWEARKSQS